MKPINTKSAFDAAKRINSIDASKRWYTAHCPGACNALAQYEKDGKEAEQDFTTAAEKLTAALDEVQSRCTVRTVDAITVINDLIDIQAKLGISKKALKGVKVTIDHNAQSFPNAYKYIPESTIITAEYKSGGYWSITGISRKACHGPSRAVIVEHTEESKKAIIDRLTAFSI